MAQGEGLKRCYEAFERLKENKPHKARFKDLDRTKITPNIVGLEAGFGDGYLKPKRHKALCELIRNYANHEGETKEKSTSKANQIKREQAKAKRAKSAQLSAEERLHFVLGENLKLVAQVRELEKRLENYEANRVVSIDKSPI